MRWIRPTRQPARLIAAFALAVRRPTTDGTLQAPSAMRGAPSEGKHAASECGIPPGRAEVERALLEVGLDLVGAEAWIRLLHESCGGRDVRRRRDVPANPLTPHAENGPKLNEETESGPTRSGFGRASIVGPCEL